MLLEAFKRVLTQNKSRGVEITENDKQLVACLLWEYIFPTITDNAILEKTIAPFFIQLDNFQDVNYLDFTIKTLLNYCSDEELNKWAAYFFKLITENMMSYSYYYEEPFTEKNKYLALILKMIKYPRLLAAWFVSPKIFDCLENLYFTHMPSKTDLVKMLPSIYYPNTIFPESCKVIFNKNMAIYCQRCVKNEELLIEITKVFMIDTTIKLNDGNIVIPRVVMINFLDFLIKKNVKYVQEFVKHIILT